MPVFVWHTLGGSFFRYCVPYLY